MLQDLDDCSLGLQWTMDTVIATHAGPELCSVFMDMTETGMLMLRRLDAISAFHQAHYLNLLAQSHSAPKHVPAKEDDVACDGPRLAVAIPGTHPMHTVPGMHEQQATRNVQCKHMAPVDTTALVSRASSCASMLEVLGWVQMLAMQ